MKSKVLRPFCTCVLSTQARDGGRASCRAGYKCPAVGCLYRRASHTGPAPASVGEGVLVKTQVAKPASSF